MAAIRSGSPFIAARAHRARIRFLPRSGAERRARLARVAADERGSVLFERPDRIPATLRDLSAVADADRPAAVCRELTKRHEEIVRGTLGELDARAQAGELVARGEAVIVVGQVPPRPRTDAAPIGPAAATVEAGRGEVERLVATGVSRSTAAGRVAAATGLPRRELYRTRDED